MKITSVCDLCALGIPEDKTCYVGVRKCLKNGVYTEFRNREAEQKDRIIQKAIESLELIDDCPPGNNEIKQRCEKTSDCVLCWKKYCESED